MSAPGSTHRLRLRACALASVLALGVAARAAADSPPAPSPERPKVQATIVHIDGDDVVIDAGGAALGQARELTVYRALTVRHPVTRKPLRDRFAIGALTVTQAGASLSVTRVSGAPAHPLAVGDQVELANALPHGAQADGAAPAATAAASAVAPTTIATAPCEPQAVPDERTLLTYFHATLAKPPGERARLYTDYLQKYPDSRFRDFVRAEVFYLQKASAAAQAKQEKAPPAPRATLLLAAPRGAEEGEPVEIAAQLRGSVAVRSLVLHARALEQPRFQSLVMRQDERGHARATIPASLVRAPGFAFFIEAVDTQGAALPAHGSVAAPTLVTVKPKGRAAAPAEPTTRVRFTSELVSFDDVSGRDYFLLNEGDFLYRVRFHRLYGVRLGYGHYRGQGGTVDELDVQRQAPEAAGFTYGFVETELSLHRLLGAALRATIGLGRPDDPAAQRDAVTGGFQLRARIGAADATHLVLAGELLPEIGQRAFLGLRWEAIPRVPMASEVVVTDQPVNSDELAVRLVYEIGYRFTDRVQVALRPSYQLRTIRHAGPGIGISATFDW